MIDIESYRRDGYVVIPDVLSRAEVGALRAATDRLVEDARSVRTHDDVYDLEDDHSPESPKVRRIKQAQRHDPAYAALVRQPGIVAALTQLIGPDIRFDAAKLNLKAAQGGSAVEWHQDWAFYPHTNDDLAAVGVAFDDITMENGPLLVLPGSHRGPLYSHHASGVFVGAIDVDESGLDVSGAVPLTMRAGSVSIHHVRMVHGSSPNRSNGPRRVMFLQYRAADAWPLLGFPGDITDYDELMVAGRTTLEPRVTAGAVRLPLPISGGTHVGQGGSKSIFEFQREMKTPYFARQ